MNYINNLSITAPSSVVLKLPDDKSEAEVSYREIDALLPVFGVGIGLYLEHQICQFHVRRFVGCTFKELQTSLPSPWLEMLAEVKQLLRDLPIAYSRRLIELLKQIEMPRSAQDETRTPLD